MKTFAAHPDRYSGGSPIEPATPSMLESALACDFRTSSVRRWKSRMDCAFRLSAWSSSIAIRSTAVEGVVEDDMPGALWIGRDDQGNRYALTMIGWRGVRGK